MARINKQLPGQYFDEETGLHYNYFRYYNTESGRYLTADLIGLVGGFNLYVFADNSPINNYDLWGLFGMFGNSVLLNEFKRGSHRINRQDAIALSTFSNQVGGTAAAAAGFGPAALAGATQATGALACSAGRAAASAGRAAADKADDILEAGVKAGCAAGIAFACATKNLDKLDDMLKHSRSRDIVEESVKPLRKHPPIHVPKK